MGLVTNSLEERSARKLMLCCGYPEPTSGVDLFIACGRCGAHRVVSILDVRRALHLGILEPNCDMARLRVILKENPWP